MTEPTRSPAWPAAGRRVVSTSALLGTSAVLSDEPTGQLHQIAALPTIWFTDLWISERAPADMTALPPAVSPGQVPAPGNGGHIVRLLEIQPDPEGYDISSGIHATPTLDHVVILCGEIYCVFDETEVLLRAGDVLIQRGVRHAWSNRSNEPCRMIGFLVDAAHR